MGIVDITDSGPTSLEMASMLLSGIPNGIQRAVKSATPRAATFLRSESNKAVRNKYDVTAGTLNKYGSSEARYPMTGDVIQADILFRGFKVPLIDFNGSGPRTSDVWDKSHRNYVFIKGEWKYRWPGKPAKGHQYKGGGSKSFDKAFIGKMPSGHVGIFDRTGGMTAENSSKIHQLMGDAPPQMIDNPEVLDPLSTSTAEKFQERLDHEVERLLNGWGGK